MAKISLKKPNLGALLAIPQRIATAALNLKQRLRKSTNHSRLLEPHLSFPGSKGNPAATAPDAADNAGAGLAGVSSESISSGNSEQWSLELLQQIEGEPFEELVAAYFREETFRTETDQLDEGIDIRLYEKGKKEVYAIIQCKACNSGRVGLRSARQLLGAMIHDNVPRGIFVTTGDYTADAVAFAKQHPILLITGEMLINDILSYSDQAKSRLMNALTEVGFSLPRVPPDIAPGIETENDAGQLNAADTAVTELTPAVSSDDAPSVEHDPAVIEFSFQKPTTDETASDAAVNSDAEEIGTPVAITPDVAPETEDVALNFPFKIFAANSVEPIAVPAVPPNKPKEKESADLGFPTLDFDFHSERK